MEKIEKDRKVQEKSLQKIRDFELKEKWRAPLRPIYTGDKFGELTVIGKSDKKLYIKCQCSCGNVREYPLSGLRSGEIIACGHGRKAFKKKINPINPTGVKGVTIRYDKYLATITDEGKVEYLGFYDNLEDATKVRKAAENNLKEKYYNHTQSKTEKVEFEEGVLVVRGRDNKSDIGVFPSKTKGKWEAWIGVNSKQISLGTYFDKEMAIETRKQAEKILLEKNHELKEKDPTQ